MPPVLLTAAGAAEGQLDVHARGAHGDDGRDADGEALGLGIGGSGGSLRLEGGGLVL
jgi:hypothetical protein